MENSWLDDIFENALVEVTTIKAPSNSSEKSKMNNDSYNEWVKVDNQFHPTKNTKVVKILEPGFYSVGYDNGKYFAIREELVLDEIYKLPGLKTDVILEELETFWEKKDLFKQSKVTHKRGILLVGGPGTGKSSFINLISKQIVDKKGIVFHAASVNDLMMISDFVHNVFRPIEPDTPIVTVIEDIDNLIEQSESTVLSFLDGEDQIEHNVTIATSNRIQDLNDLVMRPSRFDWIITIPNPDKEVREFYFKQKGLTDEESVQWAEGTEDLSMAHLKELFISVKLLGTDFKKTIDKLRDQDDMVENVTFNPKPSKERSLGFSLGR